MQEQCSHYRNHRHPLEIILGRVDSIFPNVVLHDLCVTGSELTFPQKLFFSKRLYFEFAKSLLCQKSSGFSGGKAV